MKKFLAIVIISLMLATPAYAYRANVWASWTNVTPATQITWEFPFSSRDLIIQNASSNIICVSLNGSDINVTGGARCVCTAAEDACVQLDGEDSIELYDYITDSVSFIAETSEASPVTVIVTY